MTLPKMIFVCLIGLAIVNTTRAQSSTDNYVKVYKALRPHVGDLASIDHKDSVAESVIYYDGLGRELQSVARRGSPTGHDVVTFSTYDGYGKKTVSFLPYVANQTTGHPVTDPLSDQVTFYQNLFGSVDGQVAFSQTVFEHSELGRALKQGAPGAAWQTTGLHIVSKQYLTNTAGEVFLIKYNATTLSYEMAGPPPSTDAYYAANTLNVTKTIDEEQNDIFEYVDKEGRTVCKKVKAPDGVYASTYYIYDDFGNLVVVLPPEAVKKITGN